MLGVLILAEIDRVLDRHESRSSRAAPQTREHRRRTRAAVFHVLRHGASVQGNPQLGGARTTARSA
jgi:hypothetical protein